MKGRNILILRMLTVAFVVLLAWPSLASAQSSPRLTPLPPRKGATAAPVPAAVHAAASTPSSPWQLLTNQPPCS